MRALVVDDVPAIRMVLQAALRTEGFQCDSAIDGIDALQHMMDQDYDLVVTDLSMPRMNGHALAVKLLERERRPRIVVHSGIDDARLAKDLMLRGVDDIIFKPANYRAFAAKMKGLLQRTSAPVEARVRLERDAGPPTQREDAPHIDQPSHDRSEVRSRIPVGEAIPLSDILERLPLVSRILPVSRAAFDVFEMTREGCDAPKLGQAIKKDPALAAEVLSIANSSFYNPSGKPIGELDRAVVRIGQRRTGELALAASTLSGMTSKQIPWLDMQTVWRQSIAAGVAAEMLVAQGRHGPIGENLALIAIMNSLGRIVLGTLYPAHYRHFVKRCFETGESLIDQEREAFPESHSSVMARLLTEWNLSQEICKPMQHVLDPPESLSQLSEQMRTKVELVKLAVFIGQVAMQAWHPWDLVDVPTSAMLERLRIHDVGTILEQTRENSQSIVRSNANSPGNDEQATDRENVLGRGTRLQYVRPSPITSDLVGRLLNSFGFEVVPTKAEQSSGSSVVLVNGLHPATANELNGLEFTADVEPILLADSCLEQVGNLGRKTLRLPMSCSALCSALR